MYVFYARILKIKFMLIQFKTENNTDAIQFQDYPSEISTTRYDVQQNAEIIVEESDANKTGLVYKVNDTPPWYMCIVLGLQHYITMIGGTVSIFFVVAGSLCVDFNLVLKAELLGTVFFAMGISTMLQTTIGIR